MMKPVLDAIFHGTLDIHETDPVSQEKFYQLETYFDQVDSMMGKDFGQQMRDAEFELFHAECFSYFARGFQLAVQLLLGK